MVWSCSKEGQNCNIPLRNIPTIKLNSGVLSAGTYAFTVKYTPADTTNYQITSKTVSIEVVEDTGVILPDVIVRVY